MPAVLFVDKVSLENMSTFVTMYAFLRHNYKLLPILASMLLNLSTSSDSSFCLGCLDDSVYVGAPFVDTCPAIGSTRVNSDGVEPSFVALDEEFNFLKNDIIIFLYCIDHSVVFRMG